MLEMKVSDLTERQRMKDRDGVRAAIYSHIYQNSLARLRDSLLKENQICEKAEEKQADGDKRRTEQ